MTRDDIVNLGRLKKSRLELYQKHQHKGLFVKKPDGRVFLTPKDLADCIYTLKNDLKELRAKYRAL